MSNALMSETDSVAAGPQGFGLEPGCAAESVRQSRGRISANSFRLLTAKLKGISVDEAGPAERPGSDVKEVHVNGAGTVPAVAADDGQEEPPVVQEVSIFGPTEAEFPVVADQDLGGSDEFRDAEDAPEEISPVPDLPLQDAEAGDQLAGALLDVQTAEDFVPAEPEVEAGFADETPQAAEIALPEFNPVARMDPGDDATEARADPEQPAGKSEEDSPGVETDAVGQEPVSTSDVEGEVLQAVSSETESETAAPEPAGATADGSANAQPQSEMAGRVVDAMMKTISTAIYAKPTASERAAFLREMAEQMEREEGGTIESAAPTPPAASPAGVESEISEARASDHGPAVEATGDGPEELGEVLAGRLGPSSALLKPKQDSDDPFAGSPKLALLEDPVLTETPEADDETGELALTLLDMMSGGSGSALPQERTLAADTLLRILPRIPVKQLLTVVERMAIMEAPPGLLVAKLIRDPRPEVVGPLLERCSNISDQDLINAAPTGDVTKLRMMARRRVLSQVLSDYLISTGEPNVLLTLIRNPGAALSHDAFYRLAEEATQHHALLAPLATRADLPPPVAFELFWNVPAELRRFIFSRFLTDSEALNKILRITLATHGGDGGQGQGEPKFASKDAVDAAIATAAAFKLEEAAQQLAEVSNISSETALRVLSDREGEPVAVLLKAIGYPRTRFEEVLATLRQPDVGLIRPDRKPDELQAIFDSLSFNKARILLTYWDWFVRKAGPYAPHN